MTGEKCVLMQSRDGVCRIRLNRPELHNAFNERLVRELREAAEAAASESGVRVVVLEGAGRSFCAGADVDWMRRQGEASAAENESSALELAALYERLDTLDVPLIARVHGAARGGGVGLVAVADVAVACERATFALPEVRLGILPAVISPYVLSKIGSSRTRELMLTGRQVDAREALAIGLVHAVAPAAPPEKLDQALAEVIAGLESGGPEAHKRIKRLLRELPLLARGEREALARFTAAEIAAARSSPEAREGLKAFLEKRPPAWGATRPRADEKGKP